MEQNNCTGFHPFSNSSKKSLVVFDLCIEGTNVPTYRNIIPSADSFPDSRICHTIRRSEQSRCQTGHLIHGEIHQFHIRQHFSCWKKRKPSCVGKTMITDNMSFFMHLFKEGFISQDSVSYTEKSSLDIIFFQQSQ